MDNLIALPADAQQDHGISLQPPTALTPEQISDLIGPFLPRIQLYTSNSTVVKSREFEAGHWGLPASPSTIIDLGEEVDIVLIAHRQRAMQWDGENMTASTDPNSEVYQRIKALSHDDRDSGAMYGPEFLAWVGVQQLFATLFLASQSARRETLGFMQALNQPAQVYSKIVGTRRKWEIPQIRVTSAFPFDLPTEAVVKSAWEKFTKPDDNEDVEPVPDGNDHNSRAR